MALNLNHSFIENLVWKNENENYSYTDQYKSKSPYRIEGSLLLILSSYPTLLWWPLKVALQIVLPSFIQKQVCCLEWNLTNDWVHCFIETTNDFTTGNNWWFGIIIQKERQWAQFWIEFNRWAEDRVREPRKRDTSFCVLLCCVDGEFQRERLRAFVSEWVQNSDYKCALMPSQMINYYISYRYAALIWTHLEQQKQQIASQSWKIELI